MPLSITTAGRAAAGSMGKRENIAKLVVVDGNKKILVMEVDLQLRSGIRSKTEDHGHQRRSEKRD